MHHNGGKEKKGKKRGKRLPFSTTAILN